jgi:ParB family chromosome partitioning protein
MSREERWADSPFLPGDIVFDWDHPRRKGIVINLPNKQAYQWRVPGRGLLSNDNPEYPEDDDVVVLLHYNTLKKEFPYYSGVKPLRLTDLNEEGISYYAFPSSRLKKVAEIGPHEIPVSKILPSPYHSRTFDVDDEIRLVAELDREGGLPKPALLRAVDGGRFTILNGHKRIWAAHVLGYSSVEARCMYLDDLHAAQIFASRHLDEDPEESDHSDVSRAAAIQALRDDWGETANQIPGVPNTDQR